MIVAVDLVAAMSVAPIVPLLPNDEALLPSAAFLPPSCTNLFVVKLSFSWSSYIF
jgi:hypothetical protein